MEQGNPDAMWQRLDSDISPGVALGNPLNVLTDTAAMLYRAELAGVEVPLARWRKAETRRILATRRPVLSLSYRELDSR